MPNETVESIYAAHADFVWANLQRLGVREADLADMTQEVFLVAHRRLHTWDESCRITTWLFGIARKVAAGYRRRAWFRRETLSSDVGLREESQSPSPHDHVAKAEARRRLDRVLSSLSPDSRAIFVMYEVEEASCAELAELFQIPLGTVHSRLHKARDEFKKSVARHQAKERRVRR